MAERRVTVASSVGLHARPAATFVKAAAASAVPVYIAKDGGPPVPAASLVSVLGLAVGHQEDVVLSADGQDADAVLDELATMLATKE